MMKLPIFLFFLASSTSNPVNHFKDPADVMNKDHANFACSELGDDCEKYTAECNYATAAMPNTCVAMTYFYLEVAKELCGDKYVECYEENNDFGARWMHELNLPNIGNSKRMEAFKKCEGIGMYHVKSAELQKFEREVLKVFKHIRDPIDAEPPYYQIKKEYYNCFKKHLQQKIQLIE